MNVVNHWKKEFDKWVVDTDKATIVLEEAAARLIESEDKSENGINIGADMACGECIGMCYAMAVLSGVPFNIVMKVVRGMAGVSDDGDQS